MKGMKKKIAAALSAAMVLGLTACAGGTDTEAGKNAEANKETNAGTKSGTEAAGADAKADGETKKDDGNEEKIELTLWARASSADNNQTITMDEFNASQDKIHVNVECYGDNYEEVLKLACNSGEVPDIFEISGLSDVKSYIDAGLAAPMNDYITDEFRGEFNPSAFTKYVYDGQIYAIPHMTRFIRVYYNRDLFEKAGLNPDQFPTTLEGMYDAAKAITDAGNGEFYGFGLPIKSGSTWERNVDDISILSGLTGPYAFDFTTGKFDFAKEKPIIEYFSKMYQDGLMMPGSESIDIEVLRANFIANKVGMYFDGNWMVNGYNNEIEGGDTTNWDTALVPVFEGTERAKDYLMLESGHCISASSKYPEEAFEAISYLLHNVYSAPARKDASKAAPSLSLIDADNAKINASPEVQKLKGIYGLNTDTENLSSFVVTPHSSLTLEGDSRDTVYPMLIIQGDSMDMDAELQKLSDTYNAALEKAVGEGVLDEKDLKPEGFDYYTR